MAEGMVREALKQGMKTWIITSERVRTKVAELREGLEDVVLEVRQEYKQQAEARAQPAAKEDAAATTAAAALKGDPWDRQGRGASESACWGEEGEGLSLKR
jgi:hypothetical protein